LHCRQRRT